MLNLFDLPLYHKTVKTMYKILLALILLSFSFASCETKKEQNEKKLYRNQKYVVVTVGADQGATHDKFHTPREYKLLLARSVRDTTAFIEWQVTTEKFYNTHIGDTLRFDVIRKEREFHITR